MGYQPHWLHRTKKKLIQKDWEGNIEWEMSTESYLTFHDSPTTVETKQIKNMTDAEVLFAINNLVNDAAG